MKTILIPIDFSASSIHTVNYTAELSNHQDIDQIILFSSFFVTLFEQIYPSADFIQPGEEDILEQKQQRLQQLEDLKTNLLKKLRGKISVKVALIEKPLLRAILEIISLEQPDVLFLNKTCSQMIEIAKISPVPVLVIPEKASYEPVQNALVACDFRTLNHVSLLKRLHSIKHWPHPKLALLNVDPLQKHLAPEHPGREIEGILKELLDGYEYQLYYSDDQDVLHGVLTFAKEHNQQMIIALPGIHSFLYSLTHQSITEGLSADADKPVLILK
jgi:hypothetical protein